MHQQLDVADGVRREISSRTTAKHKADFGQFMTPSTVARFMAGMFPNSNLSAGRLLDAGAGVGALTCAFLDRWIAGGFAFNTVEATAYEIDNDLLGRLTQHLESYSQVKANVISGDYIELTANNYGQPKDYTHVILNPPYKKINSNSSHRLALRSVGIETVNLYSAFVSLAISQAANEGQIVAIIPRSFCNGPYYRPFRDFIIKHTAIRHIHLFASRNKTFKDDDVLQENVIIRLERGGKQGHVTITTSTDDSFADLVTHEYPFDQIINLDNPERFIHIPTSPEKNIIELSSSVRYTLSDLGIKVSTGPVVDFRLKEHLRHMPEENTVPLIYPGHLSINGAVWPIGDQKKPNAILRNEATEKWLYPNGFYCVVRRFSSKEEKRRISASVVEPTAFGEHSVLGFENHLNLFHDNKNGLPELLARGLAVFLNSTAVDESFRRFNGHTQVNATDLKTMKYPSHETLVELGKWAQKQRNLTQETIDTQFGKLIS
ncbi:SAM-dependent methlyltransferase [Pectobacterium brasiliense]|uniref:Eco57I restriction-modification methylase domain-containing protein n=1 Tax=Pectobacterium TaxID=122277 RepID=UPI0004E66D45|nr:MULTISPECIES: Eco57I restriction-modification methylase domain-containing protein [Pectobacterium]KFF64899.1 SAM-dependent methlyltransferase [Pectobacterium brasiliense]KHT01501.1 SAM-dependent methlyltransferase [Pectobacterium brasiliense]RYC47880.1 SAM-dependent methyltransferase [Pectobacterium zantedeschiae]